MRSWGGCRNLEIKKPGPANLRFVCWGGAGSQPSKFLQHRRMGLKGFQVLHAGGCNSETWKSALHVLHAGGGAETWKSVTYMTGQPDTGVNHLPVSAIAADKNKVVMRPLCWKSVVRTLSVCLQPLPVLSDKPKFGIRTCNSGSIPKL